jgi:hypothetical protein
MRHIYSCCYWDRGFKLVERQLFFLLQKSGLILISTAESSQTRQSSALNQFKLVSTTVTKSREAQLLTSSNWFLYHRVQIRGSSAIDQFKLVSIPQRPDQGKLSYWPVQTGFCHSVHIGWSSAINRFKLVSATEFWTSSPECCRGWKKYSYRNCSLVLTF